MLTHKVKYFVISDIHLGHPRNKTSDIIFNLDQFFITYHKDLSSVDILFIAGDIFDRLLSTRSLEYRLIVNWLSRLVLWCKDNNIILRVLHGTPSHDHDQMLAFTEIVAKLAPSIDYKYINTLKVENIKKFNLNVLYVPDEWKPDAKDVYEEVQKVLKDNHLAEVDIAIMHGCFRFQLPAIKDLKFVHTEHNYLDIVKYYITIGHIHIPNVYERIIVPGSFDRLSHGEEETKGGLLCTIDPGKDLSFKFLENRLAKVFKTIDFKEYDESKITKEIPKIIRSLPKGSFIRILVKNDITLIKNLKELVSKYPDYFIKFKTDEILEKKINLLELIGEDAFEINKKNIKELILKDIGDISQEETNIFNEEINRIIEEVG